MKHQSYDLHQMQSLPLEAKIIMTQLTAKSQEAVLEKNTLLQFEKVRKNGNY